MDLIRRIFGSNQDHSDDETAVEEPTTTVEETQPSPDATKELVEPDDVGTGDFKTLQTRPLGPVEDYKSETPRIRFGMATDTGQVRDNNQDSAYSLVNMMDVSGASPPIGLFVVADGMGGHADGEVASEVTVRTIAQHVIKDVVFPQLRGEAPSADQKTIPEVLSDAMAAANEEVRFSVPNGGTTATAAVIRGDLVYVSHVGDSRAYLLLQDGTMELITRDHSLVRRLQELNQLSEEEAETHQNRNVLYRAIGQNPVVEADPSTRRLPPSSRLLICSDGLWGLVNDDELQLIIEAHADPQEACETLVKRANEKGGPDNITVILVQMPE